MSSRFVYTTDLVLRSATKGLCEKGTHTYEDRFDMIQQLIESPSVASFLRPFPNVGEIT